MSKKDFPIEETSTYTSKTKQYNVRLPLEWVPLIEQVSDNNAKFIRNAVRKELEKLGVLKADQMKADPKLDINQQILFEKFPVPPLELMYSDQKLKYDHYVLVEDLFIHPDKIRFELTGEPYQLPKFISNLKTELLNFQRKQHFKASGFPTNLVDLDAIRVDDIEINHEDLLIKASKTTTFNSLVTNYSVDVYLLDEQTTIRQKYIPGPSILSLSNSNLSNQLGGSIILVTTDNKMIMQKRSKIKLFNPNTWINSLGVPAVIEGNNEFTIRSMIEFGIENEFGMLPNTIGDMVFLGLARDMIRGGFVDVYVLVRLEVSYNQFERIIKQNPDITGEWEWEKLKGIQMATDKEENYNIIENLYQTHDLPSGAKITFDMLLKYLKNDGRFFKSN